LPRGLVGEQEQRPVDERAGDGHALLLAPRQLVREAGPAPGEPHARERVGRAVAHARARRAGHLERERHVLLGRAVGEEAEVLEHHAELAAQHRHVARARRVGAQPGRRRPRRASAARRSRRA
jgi:hypothetical protein